MKQAWLERVREVFATDLRTLALFRFALGSVLFWTLLFRLPDLTAFYSDAGVMPRAWIIETDNALRWSLHFASGAAGVQGVLILVQALIALMFALGWRTRLSNALSWALLVSLHNRNPLVLIGGDYLMVCLLFWGLFLPLGARWSVDAALSPAAPPAENRWRSWASAGLLLQVLSVYFFSGLLKSDPVWWPDGTAVYYALALDRYAMPVGQWIRHSLPWLMQPLSYFVWFLEWLGPLLALSPVGTRPLRFLVMGLLVLMHTGFALCLAIGHFPYVSLASLTVLAGGWLWDRAARDAERGEGVRVFCATRTGETAAKLLRTFLILPALDIRSGAGGSRVEALMAAHGGFVVIDRDDAAHVKWGAITALLARSRLLRPFAGLARALRPPLDRAWDLLARLRWPAWLALPAPARAFTPPRWSDPIAALFVFACLAWNIATLSVPGARAVFGKLAPLFYPLRLDQVWDMFAPYPSRGDGWYVIPGKLSDGSEIDLLHPARDGVDYEKPASVSADIPNVRWQAYQSRLYDHRFAHHRAGYARYLCRQWNASAPPERRLESFKIIYMLETTLLDNQKAPVEQRVLWTQDCGHPPPENEGTAAGEPR